MQIIGYVLVNGEKVKLLARISRTQHTLRLRVSGKDGEFLEDESRFLSENPNILTALNFIFKIFSFSGRILGINLIDYQEKSD